MNKNDIATLVKTCVSEAHGNSLLSVFKTFCFQERLMRSYKRM